MIAADTSVLRDKFVQRGAASFVAQVNPPPQQPPTFSLPLAYVRREREQGAEMSCLYVGTHEERDRERGRRVGERDAEKDMNVAENDINVLLVVCKCVRVY
jgi:hypothetical protein